jgi:lysyl endopeptidase
MHLRHYGLALAALLLCVTAHAYTPELSDLANVRQMAVNVAVVKSAVASAKSQPLQFAVGADLGANADSGSWDEPEAGIARWRLRVHSDGALSLNFAFSTLALPPDATLYLYTDGGADVQGPYTSADNGAFVSPIVRGETAVLEARMPSAQRSAFTADVARVFHAYRSITSKSFPYDDNGGSPTGNGASGACEKDVACSIGDNWPDEIRSTVLLTITDSSGSFLCSGTLVNNAAQDDRALILTAHHCEITASSVTSTRAYFNVERAGCGSGAYGSVTQNIAGKTVVAGTSGTTVTDYTLFELASVPPASFDVHYAGWEVSGTAPTSGAVIHHPAGDDKKLSTYTTAATNQDNVPVSGDDTATIHVDAWKVTWAQGATEGGSSGSALLNQNHRIVGTLSGGNSACAVLGSGNNGGSDYFARLDKAWTAASSTGTTLKTALAGSSGCTTLDGKNKGAASAVDCSGSSTGSTTGGSTTGSSTASNDSGDSGGGALGLLFAPLAVVALWRRRRAAR